MSIYLYLSLAVLEDGSGGQQARLSGGDTLEAGHISHITRITLPTNEFSEAMHHIQGASGGQP